MDINIKYDLADIAESVTKDAAERVTALVKAEMSKLCCELREVLMQQVESISAALSITDDRRRERVRKAFTKSLDKWTQGVLNGK